MMFSLIPRKRFRAGLLGTLALTLTLGLGSGAALAQDDDEPPQRQTKKAEALSKPVYDKLTKAQEAIDEKDVPGARRIIDGMLADDITDFERTNVLNFKGFIEYSSGNTDGAIRAYEQLVGLPTVEPQMRLQTIYTLAQLHATEERYNRTISYLNEWFAATTNPAPEPYVLLAQAYAQTEQFDKMIAPLDAAIAEAKERGTTIREDWYNLKYYACYQLERYTCVRDTLKILLVTWPKKSYWMALGGIYSELDQEKEMLAVYEAAHTQGILTSESELVTMAQLYLQGEIPYKAAKVLEEGMDSGAISQDAKNYRLLSQAWTLAAEDDKAIPALREAARRTSDGDLDARLAIAYLNTEQYAECVDAGREGLRKGGLQNPSDSQITIGMCLYNLDRLGDAKNTFRQAARSDRSRNLAQQWIKVITSDEARLEQLRLARQQVRRDRERDSADD
ncbi:MAG: hypothetical protein AAFS02_04515 [Pseudomonadota bacterium]